MLAELSNFALRGVASSSSIRIGDGRAAREVWLVCSCSSNTAVFSPLQCLHPIKRKHLAINVLFNTRYD